MASKTKLSRVMTKAAAYRKKGYDNETALEKAWDDEGGRSTTRKKSPVRKKRTTRASTTAKAAAPKRKRKKSSTPRKRSTGKISLLEKLLS